MNPPLLQSQINRSEQAHFWLYALAGYNKLDRQEVQTKPPLNLLASHLNYQFQYQRLSMGQQPLTQSILLIVIQW